MRVGLNLLPVVPGIGGAWHYIANLLEALAEHDRQSSYHVFVTRESEGLVPRQSNFAKVVVPLPARYRSVRIAFENVVLPLLSRRRQLDCMHHFFGTLPFFGGEPTLVTLFDLMVFARPGDFSSVKRWYLRGMRRRAARHATMLAPMSCATAEALRTVLGVPPERMTIIPPSISERFRRRDQSEIDAFLTRYRLVSPF